jgi:hypothetical protein
MLGLFLLILIFIFFSIYLWRKTLIHDKEILNLRKEIYREIITENKTSKYNEENDSYIKSLFRKKNNG